MLPLLVFLFICSSLGEYSGKNWRILLREPLHPYSAEPYRTTRLSVELDGCGEVPPTDVYWFWTFGGARTDLGEPDSVFTQTATWDHEFRGTGRRTLSVSACINSVTGFTPENLVWCKGDIVSGEFEIIVQYVRRAIRDLPQEEWDQLVDAMWILKRGPEEELQRKYGEFCHTYDWLTAFHYRAAMNVTCDQAHVWSGFLPAHRAYQLLLERSIQSIYPHLSLAYWDQAFDGFHYKYPIQDSVIWGPNYFGGGGDPNDNYKVKNGRFAGPGKDWKIAKFSDYLDASEFEGLKNPYGYMRAPWNANKAPVLTRILNNTFGLTDPRGHVQWMNISRERECLEASDYNHFSLCLTDAFLGAHAWVHMMLGGAINSKVVKIPDSYPDIADQYKLVVFRLVLASVLLQTGATSCPSTCDPELVTLEDIGDCFCTCVDPINPMARAVLDGFSGAFGLPVPAILTNDDPRNLCQIGGIIGDMMDSTSSPNDPVFHFFHSDLERIYQYWQILHLDKNDVYGSFPEVGFCEGHGLYDTILGSSGPTIRQLGLGNENRGVTIAELIDRTLPPEFGTERISPYTYQVYSAWKGQGIAHPEYAKQTEDTFCDAAGWLTPSFLFALAVLYKLL